MDDKSKIVEEFLGVEEPSSSIVESDADFEQCEIIGDPVLGRRIVKALTSVYDPEIPVNIYDLGLIYKVLIEEDTTVKVDMTLTAPGCPVAHTFPGMIEAAIADVEGVKDAEVELIWDPPWTMDRMSEAAKLELGMF
jgi:FeS assembly SUF system protein